MNSNPQKSETMKSIPNYEGFYSITNTGRVYSVKKKAFIKPMEKNYYQSVYLTKNKQTRRFTIHKLMALTFLNWKPNPKQYVGRINGLRQDNNLENLIIKTKYEYQ